MVRKRGEGRERERNGIGSYNGLCHLQKMSILQLNNWPHQDIIEIIV